MKIYTRKGDTGTTSLQSGTRVPKSDPRIAACGCLDELNAHLGLLLSMPDIPEAPRLSLHLCQSDLFSIGAWVSSSSNLSTSNTHYLDKIEASRLEKNIDEMESHLPALVHFILPGGTPAASQTHVCRTVCRRAEIAIHTAQVNTSGISTVTAYMNRLSDFLFVLSRYLNHIAEHKEAEWQG